MSNHTTGAQRYNKRMDEIFERAKSEGRGLNGNSHTKGMGVNSPAMMEAKKKIAKKMKKPKMSDQDREDALTNAMVNRLKTKSKGVSMTKKYLG